MTITICASVDFSPKIIETANALQKMGHRVNIPYITGKIKNGEISFAEYLKDKEAGGDLAYRDRYAVDMIRRYWDFIKNSDAILVVNMDKKGIKGYIGGSVLMEMGFAYGFGKQIYLYGPIPERSERLHYVDEIIEMKPIVINGNLAEIR